MKLVMTIIFIIVDLCYNTFLKVIAVKYVIKTTSAEETRNLGKKIGNFLFAGAVITLTGDLGAGKTTFTGGVAESLGINEKVSSPTFNIMKCYFHGKLPMYHIDAYRLEDGTNKDLGLEEYIEGDGVCLIEWPNFIQEKIDKSLTLNVEILHETGDTRQITISSENDEYKKLFQSFEVKK